VCAAGPQSTRLLLVESGGERKRNTTVHAVETASVRFLSRKVACGVVLAVALIHATLVLAVIVVRFS
jgi:hypothetical protein